MGEWKEGGNDFAANERAGGGIGGQPARGLDKEAKLMPILLVLALLGGAFVWWNHSQQPASHSSETPVEGGQKSQVVEEESVMPAQIVVPTR